MSRATKTSPTATLWSVLCRSILTRPRVAGLAVLGLVAIGLGLGIRLVGSVNRSTGSWLLVTSYGLALLVPVVTLVFSSAALGDLAEDGTLVYLWLRPVPRWKLAAAAFYASMTASVPLAVLPLVVGTALTGGSPRIVAGAAAGGALATVAYSAVFCGLGLRVRRALAWGVAYLIIWEQAVARVSHGAARASIFVNTSSVAAFVAHRKGPINGVAWSTGLGFSLVITIVAIVVTAWMLDRTEVP